MALWAGQIILGQSPPNIAFSDLNYLLDMFTESSVGETVTVKAKQPWGGWIKAIANSSSTVSPHIKKKNIAKVLLKLLAKVCHSGKVADVWKANECPVHCSKAGKSEPGLSLKERYPRMYLGQQTRRDGADVTRRKIEIFLHRLVCYFSSGEPPSQTNTADSLASLATHRWKETMPTPRVPEVGNAHHEQQRGL